VQLSLFFFNRSCFWLLPSFHFHFLVVLFGVVHLDSFFLLSFARHIIALGAVFLCFVFLFVLLFSTWGGVLFGLQYQLLFVLLLLIRVFVLWGGRGISGSIHSFILYGHCYGRGDTYLHFPSSVCLCVISRNGTSTIPHPPDHPVPGSVGTFHGNTSSSSHSPNTP